MFDLEYDSEYDNLPTVDSPSLDDTDVPLLYRADDVARGHPPRPVVNRACPYCGSQNLICRIKAINCADCKKRFGWRGEHRVKYVIKANDPKQVLVALTKWARLNAAGRVNQAKENSRTASARRLVIEASVYNDVADFLEKSAVVVPES